MDNKSIFPKALAFVAIVFITLLVLLTIRYVVAGFRHGQCQSGEDDAIERQFEDGSRMNCDDLRPSWPW